jgi:hypothetical protein
MVLSMAVVEAIECGHANIEALWGIYELQTEAKETYSATTV